MCRRESIAGVGRFPLAGVAMLLLLPLLAAACASPDLSLPLGTDVEAAYQYQGQLEAEMKGNVAEVTVYQPNRQLSRGGSLWAKVGPYIFLFSEETQALFDTYGGLAAVRVVTKAPGGREVARAMLPRDALNDVTWNKALVVSGLARRDGSKSPTRIEDLVRFGEDLTEFEYSPRYVRR